MGIITLRMNTPRLTNRQIVIALVLHNKMEAAREAYLANGTTENYGKLIVAITEYEEFKEARIEPGR